MRSSCTFALDAFLHADPSQQPPDPTSPTPLALFLHPPRCAGRTLHFCLLTATTWASSRCSDLYTERSLLNLRSHPPRSLHCSLLATHGGFDVTRKHRLPPAAVLVQLRNPVDRVFSAYYFALEIAAASLWRTLRIHLPNNQQPARPHHQHKQRTRTQNVWPWSYLVPHFESALHKRILRSPGDKLRALHSRMQHQPAEHCAPLDGDLSFDTFVRSSLAHELLHNGQLLQLLGLSNVSVDSDVSKAGVLRSCALLTQSGVSDVQHQLLHRAKIRLSDEIGFVSVKEHMDDTVPHLVTRLGSALSASSARRSKRSKGADRHQNQSYAITVQESWEGCSAKKSRKSEHRTKAAQRLLGGQLPTLSDVPSETIALVQHLNWADTELHQLAMNISLARLATDHLSADRGINRINRRYY